MFRKAFIVILFILKIYTVISSQLSYSVSKLFVPLSQRGSSFTYLTRKLGDDVSAEMNWDPKSHPKLDFNEDYYTLLEVDPDIDSKMLKKAYYKMVFKYHPDNKETKEEKSLANKQMMVINGAYSVLKDAELRKIYDSKRKNGIFGASAVRAKAKYKYQSPTSSSNYSSVSDSSRQSRVDTNIPFEESRQRYQKTSETKCQTTESFSKQNEKFYNENEISGESIGDLLSDLWEDLSSRGGKRLLEDFKEILLEQGPVQENVSAPRSKQQLESELFVLRQAAKNLENHIMDMTRIRTEEEAKLAQESTPNTNKTSENMNVSDNSKRIEILENRLRRIEALKGLQARISEAEKQRRYIFDQIDDCMRALNRFERNWDSERTNEFSGRQKFDEFVTSSSAQSSSSNSYDRYNEVEKKTSRNKMIDEELEKMKREIRKKL